MIRIFLIVGALVFSGCRVTDIQPRAVEFKYQEASVKVEMER